MCHDLWPKKNYQWIMNGLFTNQWKSMFSEVNVPRTVIGVGRTVAEIYHHALLTAFKFLAHLTTTFIDLNDVNLSLYGLLSLVPYHCLFPPLTNSILFLTWEHSSLRARGPLLHHKWETSLINFQASSPAAKAAWKKEKRPSLAYTGPRKKRSSGWVIVTI